MFKIEHNVITGEILEIPLTAEEIAENEILRAQIEERAAKIETEAEAKATAKAALLTQLGITAEQAKLLLS
jgi:hypothetical protein